MPDYKRILQKGGTYFFTVVTYQRLPVFQSETEVDLFKKCIKATMRKYPFEIEATVILPDHIHAIWTLPDEDGDFSTRWRLIKKRFSLQYLPLLNSPLTDSRIKKQEQGIWQRRFWEHLIRDDEDFNRHCDYIHYNPVKHGLVESPGLWKHTSYHQFVSKGLYSPDWGRYEPLKIQSMNNE
jgi:putative transposase